jgi:methylmalonyl-CoA/ethylmalonyl-CoA epimerase
VKPAYLDHIGIAVNQDSRLAEALKILGLPITGQERVEREKVDTEWVPLPEEAGHVELLHPTEPDSVIGKFLEKNKKDAVHHLSFRVENVAKVSDQLRAAGFRMIYPEPRSGAHNCLVNFLHPQSTGGVLLEITEKLGSAKTHTT